MIAPSPRVLAYALGGSQSLFSKLYSLPWYRGMLHEWVEGLDLGAGTRVIEVGSSGGDLTGWLAHRGHDAVGVDGAHRAGRTASRRHPHATFLTADAADLPYGRGDAAAVIGASIINLIPDRVAVLAEFGRVAAGGTVSVLFPSRAFDDAACAAYLEDAGISGFAAAAYKTWHASAAKLDVNRVAQEASTAGLVDVQVGAFAGGIAAAVTGRAEA